VFLWRIWSLSRLCHGRRFAGVRGQQLFPVLLPIEGFCVAAGIPTTEKAAEIISGLKSVGIRHVAFKPGSVDGIRQVVNIAAANPGGRAGGHHSFEDFYQPILATYSSIRRHDNIALVAGFGFGGSDDTWPYLTGDWSKQFGVEPMPFDGTRGTSFCRFFVSAYC
jgi:fatty acid synthase subunit alpha, fungi type